MKTIEEEIKRLAMVGYKALPCNVRLSPQGKKIPSFGTDIGWTNANEKQSIGVRMRALGGNPNGLLILTGETEKLFVVDLDRKPGRDPDGALKRASILLPQNTPRVQTPHGEHYYLKYPSSLHSGTHAGLLGTGSGIDSRGTGGFVFAPPTSIKGYGVYRWIVDPETPLAEVPATLAAHLIQIESRTKDQPINLGFKTITQLSPKQRKILMERFQQAKEEGEKEPGGRDRSHYDFRLACWAIAISLDKEELWNLVQDVSKFREGGRGYFEMTYKNAFERKKDK
jgi:hypothetical protein